MRTAAIRLAISRSRRAGPHVDVEDVILELDRVPVRNENDFINRVSNLVPGRKVQLKVWRDRKAILLDAVIGDWGKAESRFRR